jgi:hypothetical protein
MRRLIRPLIGIGVSLVIASFALVAGRQAASPAAPASESAMILAPVAVDGRAVPGDNDPATLDVSGGTGLMDVGTPGSADPAALPPSVRDAIAALNSAGGPDPAGAHLLIGAGASSGHGSGAAAGDPCSPTSGATPTGCPGGLRSAIFADTAPPDLEVWPVADVATAATGTSIYCPGLTHGAGELGLGVGTTVPAAVTVRYWPVSDPTDVRTVTPAADTSQVAAWNARVAATGTYPVHEFVFQHCGLLTGLRPNTDYRLSAVAIDDEFSRISDPVERPFNSAGQPTIPPLRAIPLTNSLLYVSAPNYGTTNPPIIFGWVVAAGQTADCSGFDTTHPSLQVVQAQTLVEVTHDYLHAHNYADGYDHAAVMVYDVPEGSTVVVCARWYNRAGPSWDRDTPTKQEFLVAMSPDTSAPVITLTHVDFAHSADASSVSMVASTQSGIECGRAIFPPTAVSGGRLDINQTLCDAGAPRSWMAPLGSGGNVIVSTDAARGSDVVHSSYVLPLSRYRCLGTCALPPTLTYSVPLPTVRVGSGMCGTGFGGDCTPPTAENALGTAEIQVTWTQGNVNGLDHWVVGSSDNTPPAAPPVPDAPRFDDSQYPNVTLSSDGWSGWTSFAIRSDRHVTYTASIGGDCFVGTPPAPATGQSSAPSSGVSSASVTFAGLCPGGNYLITVELVDDAGHRTVAGASRDAGTVWWPGSIVSLPVRMYAVAGSFQITTDPSRYKPWYVVGGHVSYTTDLYSDSYVDFGASASRCFTRDQFTATGTSDGSAVQARTVHVRVYARVQDEGLYFGVNHDADCSWPSTNNFVADQSFDVAWTDLARGVTMTGDLPQADVGSIPGYPEQIHYRLTLRLGPER